MNQLIVEGKNDKAKQIINLALTKMPLDYYEFYTMVEPFAIGYYKIGDKENARKLLKQLAAKYQDNLKYYSTLKSEQQNDLAVDLLTDIERYRSLLMVMKDNKDIEFYSQQKVIFNSYNKRFERFGRDME